MQASRNLPMMFWKKSKKSDCSSRSLHLSDLAAKKRNSAGGDSESGNSGASGGTGNSSGGSQGGSGLLGDSIRNQIATTSDNVFRGLRMSLKSEELGGSFHEDEDNAQDNNSSDRSDKDRHIEVGVHELYQHKLSKCIFSATDREESVLHASSRMLVDDHSPALKPLDRRRRRDSMQSLVSIERQLAKNRIGGDSSSEVTPEASESPSVLGRIRDDHSVALKPMDRRRVRDSMQSLVSIERQLAKNYLAPSQAESKSESRPQLQQQPAAAAAGGDVALPSPSAPRQNRRGSAVTRRRRASLATLSLDDIYENEVQMDASLPGSGMGSKPINNGDEDPTETTFRLRDDHGNDLLLNFHRRRASCASAISSLGDSGATTNASSSGDWSFSLAGE